MAATTRKTQKKIDENQLVEISSNVHGNLFYRCPRTQQPFKFTELGQTETMTVGQLRTLATNRKFLPLGWIRVHDPEVIQYLNIGHYQNNLFTIDNVLEMLTLEADELKSALSKLTNEQKSFAVPIIRNEYRNEKIENYKIIKAIEEGLGITLIEA